MPRAGILGPCLDAATLEELLQPLRDAPERSAVLLDVDGVLAPIVQQPDDAHMPETTRRPLIEVARRYGTVACVSGRRASDARRIVSLGSIAYLGSHGSEVLRPGSIAPELDRELQAWTRRVQAFAHDAYGEKLRRLRVRLEDKEAIAALHWRGTPDEDDVAGARSRRSPSRPRRPASSPTGAARCSRSARRCGSTRAPGSSACCSDTDLAAAVYVGDDMTDLDAFRGLTELQERGRLGYALRVGVRSDETPAGARGGGRRDGRRHGRRARPPARAADLTPLALRRLPQGHGPAQRRLGDAARRADRDRHRRASSTRRPPTCARAGGCWRR